MDNIDLNQCCRTCLTIPQTGQLKSLSTNWTNNILLTFADMLTEVISIANDLHSAEEESLKICSTCETDLITAYNFQVVCKNTERILSENKVPLQIEEIKIESFTYVQSPGHSEANDFQSADDDKDCAKNGSEIIADGSTIDSCEVFNQVKQPKKRGRKRKIKELSDDSTEPTDNASSTQNELQETHVKARSQKTKEQAPNAKKRKYGRKPKEVSAEPKPKKKRIRNSPQCRWCKRCDITFDTSQLYQVHYKEVHQVKSPCTLCGKTYYPYQLEKHIETHSADREHTCPICGNRLKNGLREHMRIHTGEKRYKCDFCDERFIHWNSKKCHMYVKHTKERK